MKDCQVLEGIEPENQINPYDRLNEIISEINEMVSGIAKKYNLEPNEVYNRIGFNIDNYRTDMRQIISSAPCCRKVTTISTVRRYTEVIESTPIIMECASPTKKNIGLSDIRNVLKELDSTKDVVLHDLESLEQELYELSKTKTG